MRHNGTSLTVAIEDDLKAVLNNGNINVTCSKGAFSIPVAECDKWVFNNDVADDNVWTGVDNNLYDSNVLLVREANRLVLRGVAEGEQITFTAINGRTLTSGKAVANTDFVINLTDVAPGIYIVTYGNHSVKLAIR